MTTTQHLPAATTPPARASSLTFLINSVIPVTDAAPLIALREAGEADRDFLLAVYASTRAEELDRVPWSDEQKTHFIRMQFEAQDRWYREQYQGTAFNIVLVDGIPAGRWYLARTPHEIRVLDVALLPAYRGRGIGASLFHEVMREAERSERQVILHVELFNRARRLYERLGFRPMGEPTGVYQCMEWRASSIIAQSGK